MERADVASRFAFAAILFFVVGMALVITQQPPATYAGSPPTLVTVVALAFTLFHLSLLPVIAALDAPAWAKGSGYAWIVVDNVIVFMGYFGVGADLIVPMRWGVHLAAATWIFGASGAAQGGMRWIGWLAVLAFVGASFMGPFVDRATAPKTLGPASLLLVIWLGMTGAKLAKRDSSAARAA